jgi:hypothetical protein
MDTTPMKNETNPKRVAPSSRRLVGAFVKTKPICHPREGGDSGTKNQTNPIPTLVSGLFALDYLCKTKPICALFNRKSRIAKKLSDLSLPKGEAKSDIALAMADKAKLNNSLIFIFWRQNEANLNESLIYDMWQKPKIDRREIRHSLGDGGQSQILH